MKRLGLLVSGLAILSSSAWAGTIERLNKLDAECRAGKAESCQKLVHIAKNAKD